MLIGLRNGLFSFLVWVHGEPSWKSMDLQPTYVQLLPYVWPQWLAPAPPLGKSLFPHRWPGPWGKAHCTVTLKGQGEPMLPGALGFG